MINFRVDFSRTYDANLPDAALQKYGLLPNVIYDVSTAFFGRIVRNYSPILQLKNVDLGEMLADKLVALPLHFNTVGSVVEWLKRRA